jgi:hypothetical protein
MKKPLIDYFVILKQSQNDKVASTNKIGHERRNSRVDLSLAAKSQLTSEN